MLEMLRKYYWLDDALNRNLHRLGWPDVTRSQCLVFLHIAMGINRASQIARNLGVTRQAMSLILNEMREKNLVEFRPDPTDKRAIVVHFYEADPKIREDAVKIIDFVEGELQHRIGARSFTKFIEILKLDWGDIPRFEP
jgi:DNA-binding MarR family transcriptional regulator